MLIIILISQSRVCCCSDPPWVCEKKNKNKHCSAMGMLSAVCFPLRSSGRTCGSLNSHLTWKFCLDICKYPNLVAEIWVMQWVNCQVSLLEADFTLPEQHEQQTKKKNFLSMHIRYTTQVKNCDAFFSFFYNHHVWASQHVAAKIDVTSFPPWLYFWIGVIVKRNQTGSGLILLLWSTQQDRGHHEYW